MSTTPSSTPTPEPDDAWLETILRQPSPTRHGPESADADAFTARVLAALPPPAASQRRAAQRRRTIVLLAAVALGCATAWILGGPAMMESLRETTHLAQTDGAHLHAIETGVVYGLAGISSVAMVWVFARRDLRRLFQ